jgi:hypothetical protein
MFLFLLQENPSHVLRIEGRRKAGYIQTRYLKGGGKTTAALGEGPEVPERFARSWKARNHAIENE